MVPASLIFWSISRKESLESQKKHAFGNRFLRTLLCSNDILKSGYNRKVLMRRRTSIADGVCFDYEQLFHPKQCTACRICECSSRDKLVWPEVTVILSFSDQLQYLWGINCFGNGTRQYSTCLYQSGCLHILFCYHYIFSNKKYIGSNELCIARHDDKMCFLPICTYHIILIGNIKELLQKMDAFCFNYQHVDCLYTLFWIFQVPLQWQSCQGWTTHW